MIAGVDRHADAARRPPQRAPGGDLARALEHLDVIRAEHFAHALGGLAGQLGGLDPAQRALAQRRHRRLLLGLPAQPRLRFQAVRDVAPDREQQRAVVAVHDAPAHLADELGAVLAPPVRPLREAQRMVELEVEVEVAAIAPAHALRPQCLDRLAEQLVALVAELRLGEPVDEHDAAVAGGADGRVRQPLEYFEQSDAARLQGVRRVVHDGLSGQASSSGGQGMRAAVPAWPLSGGTIGDVSTTSSPGRLRGHDLLCAVAEGTAGAVGEAFLRGLVRHVAEAFGAKMVMVAEASDPTGMHVEVIACWYDGAYLDEPFEYDTAGTPCAVTTEYPWVSFPEALAERFPEDEIVVDLGLQSYLAVCLKSSQGVHLGHLAVLDSRPMEANEEDATALRIFAARAGAELERRNQERRLAESRARVIEAADKERRRVGRDLHDGAQQRLLAGSHLLRAVPTLLRVSQMKRAEDDPARALVAQAEEELAHAHAELRKLARGLHPVALRERGLGRALASLCQSSDVPIDGDVFEGELPLPVARRAFFVAS